MEGGTDRAQHRRRERGDRRGPRGPVLTGLFALFAALTIAWTWPLAARPASVFVTAGALSSPLALADLHLTSWIVSWGAHQLRHDPLRLFDANLFHPLPQALAFSEHMLAGAFLVLPLDLAHHDPVLNHNVLLLASFTLAGAGTALLVRDLGGSLPAAVFGGALFAFGPLRQAQLGHLHALSTHWMPFALLFLQRFLRTGRSAAGIAFAASLLLVALSSVYHLCYFGLGIGLFVLLHALWRVAAAPTARRRALGLGLLVFLVLLPTLLPYVTLRRRFALASNPDQAVLFSAVGTHYLGALLDPRAILGREFFNGRILTPLFGLGAAALAIVGVTRGAARDRGGRRLAAAYGSLAVALALVSLGPVMRMDITSAIGIPGPHALLAHLPGFDGLRVPQRAAAGALLALAVLAGLGADALVGRTRSRARRGLAIAVLAAVLGVECRRPALSLVPAAPSPAALAVSRWLATQPGDFPVVELPLGQPEYESLYMMLSTYHWKRLVNGYSGSFPARNYLEDVFSRFPDATSLRLARDLRVRYVVAHSGLLPPQQRHLCRDPGPWLVVRHADGSSCVLEILGAPEPPVRPPDRALPLASARITTSSGDGAAAVTDGDLRTHWTERIDAGPTGWLEIRLAEPRPLTRLVVRLGPHFGEHLWSYQVATPGAQAWSPIATRVFGEPPLAGLLTDPENLAVEIPLDGRPIDRLRLVRPPPPLPTMYLDWGWWGVHEIELYEAIGPP
jgi:hypothetical protein